MLSITNIVENTFCPKFTYYGIVLGLEQYEQKRGTVQSGRRHHANSEKTNKNFVPKNLSGEKITSVKMYSKKYRYVGVVDHAIITDDEVIIIERKYMDQRKIFSTLKVQLGLLAILLEENLHKPVHKAYVIFTKNSSRTQTTVEIDAAMREHALNMLTETRQIISMGSIPNSSYDSRCVNCCYRNVCDVGSLNTP